MPDEDELFLDMADADEGSLDYYDENKNFIAKPLNKQRYLMTMKPQDMIKAIDNTIKAKRSQDNNLYEYLMKNKSIMECLKQKKG